MIHTVVVNALFYPSITSNLATLTTLSLKSDSVYTHTCSPFFFNPLEVTRDGQNRPTNKLVASVK